MKRNNSSMQHVLLENMHIKSKYNELLDSHKKLQNQICIMNHKLDQLYKCHANSVLLLQEKKHK